MLYDQIGSNIKLLRQQRGMTQDQLAGMLCVSHQMISKYESGATAPDITMLVRICETFGVTLDVLCGLDEDSRDVRINRLFEKYSRVPSSLTDAEKQYSSLLSDAEGISRDDRVLSLSLRLLEAIKKLSPKNERAEISEKLFEKASEVLDISKDDELRSYANYLLALYYWEKPASSSDYEKNLALSRSFASKILLCTYFPDYRMLIGNDTRSEKLISDLHSQNLNFFAKMLKNTRDELSRRGISPVSSEISQELNAIFAFHDPIAPENHQISKKETIEMRLEPITLPSENYDWSKTLKPEQPYIHDYSKSFTYKLFLANPNESWDASVVRLTFEDALEVIKHIDRLTHGIPKIVYLVGWQYFGHDSKYPAWDEVNESLKRQNGESALESLKWLINEGFRYNTTISLHINIKDAYDDSPLWQTYIDNDLLAKSANGDLRRGGVWNNKQAYTVSYCREWETGYLRARIDRLSETLPIVRAGTIHIDAMQASDDPGHGYTLEDCQKTRNQIVRYFRKLGIDVTTEFIYYETPDWREKKEQLIGLCPLVYHMSQNLDEYLKRPADLITGVYCSRRFKEGNSDLMYKLFGQSVGVERIILREKPENRFPMIFDGICLELFKLLWLNSKKREKAVVTADNITAYFSDGIETDLSGNTKKNGILIGYDGTLLCPVSQMGDDSYVFYSRDGGSFAFDMKKAFGYSDDQKFELHRFTENGIEPDSTTKSAENGILTFDSPQREGLVIKALRM